MTKPKPADQLDSEHLARRLFPPEVRKEAKKEAKKSDEKGEPSKKK